MSVTERLMKPGQFELRLRRGTPYGVLANIALLDHVVITPTRLDSPSNYSDASVLAASMYTGVITAKPTPTSVAGSGLGFWLGTENGLGDLLDTEVSNSAGSLSTWVTSLRPSSLSAGTVNNTGTSTHTYAYQWMSRREAFEHMLRAVGAEYRINPNGSLDAATAANLFTDYTTPKVVITLRPEGYEGDFRGLEATDANPSSDVEGYTTKIIVVGRLGDGAQIPTGSATGSNVYKDLFNNNAVFERFANAPTEPAGNVDAYAASLLAQYPSSRKSLTLSTRTYALPMRCRPGDRVYVYDPGAGIFDTSNQITWRGKLITPLMMRVKSYTWPIERGFGVYVRRSGSTPVYFDVTEYVEWEDGQEATWEVGTSVSDPDQDAHQLGPAFLGANGEILDRVSLGQRKSFTPTWSGTLGNGILAGTYQVIGGWVRLSWSLTWGTTTSHTASTQTFNCPSGLLPTAVVEGSWLGGCRIIDNGLANYGRHIVRAGSTMAIMDDSGNFASNTVPHTWANLDQLIAQAAYPL